MTEQEQKTLLRVRFELNRYLMVKLGDPPDLEEPPDETRRLIRQLDAIIVGQRAIPPGGKHFRS